MGRYDKVMIIAGSDSGGGAGLQADLKTATVLGSFATNVVTTVTAQNTQGVESQLNMAEKLVEAQFSAIVNDIGTDAIKIGLLPTAPIIELVQRLVKDHRIVVVDPVMVATSGHVFLDENAQEALTEMVTTTGSLITPNIAEAQILANWKVSPKHSRDFEKLLHILSIKCNRPILLKGGHSHEESCTDYLIDWSGNIHRFKSERIATSNTHGTGCTLATAIAVYLAKGYSLEDSVRDAKAFLLEALRSGVHTSVGRGSGPVNHMWQMMN